MSVLYIPDLATAVSLQQLWTYPSGFSPNGPYVDRLLYVYYSSDDQDLALQALQVGSVYAYDESVSNTSVYVLSFNPDIEVTSELGYGYRQFILNCQVFPTNITGYRRALAYALDKYQVVERATGGLAEPLDSAIPLTNPLYACESEMPEHFYDFDPVSANLSLQNAHFIDTPDSPHPGWRYYDADMSGNWTLGDKPGNEPTPDGVKVTVWVSGSYWPAIEAGLELVECMHLCGLDAQLYHYNGLWDWNWWLTSGNVLCAPWAVPPPGVPELLYEYFHSEAGTNQFFYRYNNSEYDYNVTMMIQAPTQQEAHRWLVNSCRILLQDMPMLVCYNDVLNHAYRVDYWEGYVNMLGLNNFGENLWTLRKVQLKEEFGGPWPPIVGPQQGTVEYVLTLTEGVGTYSTNILEENFYYSGRGSMRVLNQVYSRLWQLDPYTWEPVPDLASHWTIEHTNASGDIQEGQKFTFHLFENVTWHDGTPITSADVAYNFEKIYQLTPYAEPDWGNIYRVDTPDDYTVEVYTNQSDFFEFFQITYQHILPKHIWQPYENQTSTDPFSWYPETPEELTGSGPFQWVTFVSLNYVVLDRYPDYHFGVERTYTYLPDYGGLLLLAIYIIGVVVICIQVFILTYLLSRRGRHRTP